MKPGTKLFGPARRYQARIRADGSLKHSNGMEGSIHKIGAMLQDSPSCNGWTFWHVSKGNKLVSIDDFREKIRMESA